jgi:phosphate starvation-inducible membrane PsiE
MRGRSFARAFHSSGANKMHDLKDRLDRFGDALVSGFQIAALFVIGATIVWTAVHAYSEMMLAGRAGLDDILLLFIYLELGAIVGIYFKTERLPVLFLLYVAITAITRFLAGAGSILVLTLGAEKPTASADMQAPARVAAATRRRATMRR